MYPRQFAGGGLVTALPIDVASAEQARQISAHLLLLAALRDNADTAKSAEWISVAPQKVVRKLLACALLCVDDDLLDEVRDRWGEATGMWADLEQTIAAVEATLV